MKNLTDEIALVTNLVDRYIDTLWAAEEFYFTDDYDYEYGYVQGALWMLEHWGTRRSEAAHKDLWNRVKTARYNVTKRQWNRGNNERA